MWTEQQRSPEIPWQQIEKPSEFLPLISMHDKRALMIEWDELP